MEENLQENMWTIQTGGLLWHLYYRSGNNCVSIKDVWFYCHLMLSVSRVRYLSHQLWLNIEHHELVRINAPPHSEACFCFKLWLMWAVHTHSRTPSWLAFESRFSRVLSPTLYHLAVLLYRPLVVIMNWRSNRNDTGSHLIQLRSAPAWDGRILGGLTLWTNHSRDLSVQSYFAYGSSISKIDFTKPIQSNTYKTKESISV